MKNFDLALTTFTGEDYPIHHSPPPPTPSFSHPFLFAHSHSLSHPSFPQSSKRGCCRLKQLKVCSRPHKMQLEDRVTKGPHKNIARLLPWVGWVSLKLWNTCPTAASTTITVYSLQMHCLYWSWISDYGEHAENMIRYRKKRDDNSKLPFYFENKDEK